MRDLAPTLAPCRLFDMPYSPHREHQVDRQQQTLGRTIGSWVMWIGGSLVALALVFIIYGGYRHGWKWTGLIKDADFPRRTLWDWLDLLIVPAVLAVGGYLFTRSENQRTQHIAERQRDVDREIADERRRDDTLQAYLDGMSELLLDENRPLRQSKEGDEVRTLARARTLTVLARLDGSRKGSVVQFLYESGLIARHRTILDESGLIEKHRPVVELTGANLNGVLLSEAILPGVDLSGSLLEGVNLNDAFLSGANLNRAHLDGAVLSHTDLNGANLYRAHLNGANLSDADLSGADLSEADLSNADLSNAQLSYANPKEQLGQAKSLKGATMPNGQKYEDQLNSNGRGEGGENTGSS
jgi:uncharacterized protein YjbI with pentapeptide repeats